MFMESRENVRQRDSCFPNKRLAYSERSMLCSDDFLKAADWTRPWLADPLELEGVRSVGAVK
jgi:hypothetical protein